MSERESLPEPLAELERCLERAVVEWIEWLEGQTAIVSYASRVFKKGVWVGAMKDEGDSWFQTNLEAAVVEALEHALEGVAK